MTEDQQLYFTAFLSEWGMNADSQLLFKECGINCIDTFKLLNNSDIDKIFCERHMLGEKLIFREKFEKWKSKNTVSVFFFYTQAHTYNCNNTH